MEAYAGSNPALGTSFVGLFQSTIHYISYMKTCSRCKQSKPETEFNKGRPGKLHSWCKTCVREDYENNKNRLNPGRHLGNKRRAGENLRFIYEFLLKHQCVDCGESNPVVLDFDHVRGEKHREVSAMLNHSRQMLIDEISKCDIRCANCHRIKTAKEHGWRIVDENWLRSLSGRAAVS